MELVAVNCDDPKALVYLNAAKVMFEALELLSQSYAV